MIKNLNKQEEEEESRLDIAQNLWKQQSQKSYNIQYQNELRRFQEKIRRQKMIDFECEQIEKDNTEYVMNVNSESISDQLIGNRSLSVPSVPGINLDVIKSRPSLQVNKMEQSIKEAKMKNLSPMSSKRGAGKQSSYKKVINNNTQSTQVETTRRGAQTSTRSKTHQPETTVPESILKNVTINTHLGEFVIHRLDKQKLDELMENAAHELREKKEAISVIDQIQFLQERRARIMQGKPADYIGSEHQHKFNRPVLQIDKPHAIQLPNGAQIGPAGHTLQSRYVEQWINDVLKDAEGLNFKGLQTYPEQSLPINRYEIDKQSLMRSGIPIESVERIYRSLFVHSVGFFHMIQDFSQHCPDNKHLVVANIWRVYQILLEYACKSEYKLITKFLEQKHLFELEQKDTKIRQLNQMEFMKDQTSKKQMADLNNLMMKTEKEKAEKENAATRLFNELQNNQKKLEEEVRLRLFFENKINILNHEENKNKSKIALLQEKFDALNSKYEELRDKNKVDVEEIYELRNYKNKSSDEYLKLQIKLDHNMNRLDSLTKILKECQEEICDNKENLNEKKKSLDSQKLKLNKAEMEVASLKHEVSAKKDYINQLQEFYDVGQKQIQDSNDKYEHMKLQLAQANKEVNHMIGKVKIQQLDIKEVQTDNEGLRETIQGLKDVIEERDTEISQQNTLIKYLQEKLGEEYETSIIINDQLIKLRTVKIELEDKLNTEMRFVKNLQEDKKIIHSDYKKAQTELIKKINENNELHQKFNKFIKAYETHDKMMTAKDYQIDKMKTQFDQRVDTMIENSNDLKHLLYTTEEHLDRRVDEVRKLQLHITDLENQNKGQTLKEKLLKQEVDTLKKQKQDIKKNLDTVQDQYDIMYSSHTALKKEKNHLIELITRNTARFQNEIRELKEIMNYNQMYVEDLEGQIRRYQNDPRHVEKLAESKFLRMEFTKYIILKSLVTRNAKIFVKDRQAWQDEKDKLFRLQSKLNDQIDQLKADVEKGEGIINERDHKIIALDLRIKQLQDTITQHIKKYDDMYAIYGPKPCFDQACQTEGLKMFNSGTQSRHRQQSLVMINSGDKKLIFNQRKFGKKHASYSRCNPPSPIDKLRKVIADGEQTKQTRQSGSQRHILLTPKLTYRRDHLSYNIILDSDLATLAASKKRGKGLLGLTSYQNSSADYNFKIPSRKISNNSKYWIKSKKSKSSKKGKDSNDESSRLLHTKSGFDISPMMKKTKEPSIMTSLMNKSSMKKSREPTTGPSKSKSQMNSEIISNKSETKQLATKIEITKHSLESVSDDSPRSIEEESSSQNSSERRQSFISDVIDFMENQPREKVQELVTKLNGLNSVKVCGGLGQCFNCRNKHLKQDPSMTFSRMSQKESTYTNDMSDLTQMSKGVPGTAEAQRQARGAFFKERLKHIIGEDYNTNLDLISNQQRKKHISNLMMNGLKSNENKQFPSLATFAGNNIKTQSNLASSSSIKPVRVQSLLAKSKYQMAAPNTNLSQTNSRLITSVKTLDKYQVSKNQTATNFNRSPRKSLFNSQVSLQQNKSVMAYNFSVQLGNKDLMNRSQSQNEINNNLVRMQASTNRIIEYDGWEVDQPPIHKLPKEQDSQFISPITDRPDIAKPNLSKSKDSTFKEEDDVSVDFNIKRQSKYEVPPEVEKKGQPNKQKKNVQLKQGAKNYRHTKQTRTDRDGRLESSSPSPSNTAYSKFPARKIKHHEVSKALQIELGSTGQNFSSKQVSRMNKSVMLQSQREKLVNQKLHNEYFREDVILSDQFAKTNTFNRSVINRSHLDQRTSHQSVKIAHINSPSHIRRILSNAIIKSHLKD